MGSIVVHAGMAKAGSSAIQGFLKRDHDRLVREWDVQVAQGTIADGVVTVGPLREGPVNAGDLVPALRDRNLGPRARSALVEGLSELAERHGTVVLSGEAFEQVFWRPDLEVLEALSAMSQVHPVRVAYYARPQHTALEAAWRQWGFRSGSAPAEYLLARASGGHRYEYRETIEQVRRQAPDIDFVVRPFRRDLLDGGDVVSDFLVHFLPSVDDTANHAQEDNVGLALDLVNALQAPAGSRLWESAHRNWVLDGVKQIFRDLDANVSPQALEGRRLLQAWCHERFEHGNMAMIAAEGWPAVDWVPAVTMMEGGTRLDRLDVLWAAPASPQVIEGLVQVLEQHMQLRRSRGHGPRPGPLRDAQQTRQGHDTLLVALRDKEHAYRLLQEEHDRLTRRRSVRVALRLARLARPVVRWLRRREG